MAHSTHHRSITWILTAVATGILAGAITLPGPDAAAATATIEIHGADPAETELIDWALGRFTQAGLQLPATTITFHDDPAGCGGNSGLYRPATPAQVHLCIPPERPATTRKLIALHELAHAWAETRTDDTTRAAFLEERGLDTWHDPTTQPHLWGAEHAAETISWALMDQPVRIIRIYDTQPHQLTSAYHTLTGTTPLNPQAA